MPVGRAGVIWKSMYGSVFGNDFGNLNVLERLSTLGIHPFRGLRHDVIGVEIHRLDDRGTVRGITCFEILELELVVGRVVVQIDAFLLSGGGVDQPTHVLQEDPITRVATIDLELGHGLCLFSY